MTSTKQHTPTTDPWGRPIIDGQPRFGPLDGDETRWPAVPMRVRTEEDVVACAAAFARAFSSEYFYTVWLLAVDPAGVAALLAAELLDMPPEPPSGGLRAEALGEFAAQVHSLGPGSSLVVALASHDGGDRGRRERAWSRAVLDAAAECGLAVRGVVAVGAARARLLYHQSP